MILGKFIAFCIAVGVLAIPIWSLHVDWRLAFGPLPWLGYSLFGLGSLVSLTNFYLSLLRYPLFILRGRSRDEYRHISGFPMVGMLVLFGLALTPASRALSLATFVLLLIDTGNIPWFVVAVWRDDSFWNA
jgi:hypothetical protein